MQIKFQALGLIILFGGAILSLGARAEKITPFQKRPFLFYGATNLTFAEPDSDKVSGASYQKKMRTPLVGAIGVGVSPIKSVWLGIRYEYWFAKRELTLSGNPQTDSLNLQLIGPEVGVIRGNSRAAYLFAAGGLFPLVQEISSTSQGTFTTSNSDWKFQLRASIELRLVKSLVVHFESGYRWLRIKNLSSNGVPFISGNGPMNMSGPFVGMGLGFFF